MKVGRQSLRPVVMTPQPFDETVEIVRTVGFQLLAKLVHGVQRRGAFPFPLVLVGDVHEGPAGHEDPQGGKDPTHDNGPGQQLEQCEPAFRRREDRVQQAGEEQRRSQ